MNYHIEANSIRETLVIPLSWRWCVLNAFLSSFLICLPRADNG